MGQKPSEWWCLLLVVQGALGRVGVVIHPHDFALLPSGHPWRPSIHSYLNFDALLCAATAASLLTSLDGREGNIHQVSWGWVGVGTAGSRIWVAVQSPEPGSLLVKAHALNSRIRRPTSMCVCGGDSEMSI